MVAGPRLQGDSLAGSLPSEREEAVRGRAYLSNVCVAAQARRLVRPKLINCIRLYRCSRLFRVAASCRGRTGSTCVFYHEEHRPGFAMMRVGLEEPQLCSSLLQGIASALITAAYQHARSLGFRHLYVHCDVDNPSALQLYRDHSGFHLERHEDSSKARSLNRSRRMLLHKRVLPDEQPNDTLK